MPSSSIQHVPVAPAYLAAVHDVRYHSVALLATLMWNTLLTFNDDVQYIWPMRNKRPFKWVYFFLRYGVILAQTAHNILIEPLANGSNPGVLCYVWFAYIVAFTQVLETLLELILASRIYALYNRSRGIAFLLLVLILTEAATTVRMLWLLPLIGIYGTCLLTRTPPGLGVRGILKFTVHCTLIGLTVYKYFTFKACYSRSPIASLVVRDGTTVYGTILFTLISVAIICGLDGERGVIIPLWVMTLTSIMGCYLILSMERLAKEMSKDSSQLVFTSEIGLVPLNLASRRDDSSS